MAKLRKAGSLSKLYYTLSGNFHRDTVQPVRFGASLLETIKCKKHQKASKSSYNQSNIHLTARVKNL